MNDRTSYTRTAISLHWLVAALIFAGWGLGWYAHDLPASPDKLRYFSWHKWIGVTVFLLALLRASWRATHAPPPLPPTLPRWQVGAAHVSHLLLYVLMLALPLSGWLMSSAKGFQTVYFGVLPLPDLLAKNEPLGKLLAEVHRLLAYTLSAAVALHVLAALKHRLLDRDTMLGRMLPALVALILVGAAAGSSIDAARSEVTATFRQMNVPVEGRFAAVRGQVQFDPKNPAAAGARIEVDTASFDLGAEEYNDEVRGKEWLDSKAHPLATFVSSKVTAAGTDRFRAAGTLTLKGQGRSLEVPFAVRQQKGGRSYEGEFTVSRKAYGIGDAEWDDVLEDAVVVRFRIFTADP